MGEPGAYPRRTGGGALAIIPLAALVLVALGIASPGARADTYRLPLLPSASDALREGMVRIVNHSDEAGRVAVTAIDDSGFAFGPVAIELGARQAVRFSSTDLERGNEALGIATGIGGGQGDWRLVLDTSLDIEPLAYVHTSAGFVDSLHDVAPRRSFYHRVTLLAPDPGGGLPDGSSVRLINPTDDRADVAIFGVDDDNALAPGLVSIALAAGAARTVTARELEIGAAGLSGRLGDGDGDWQLLIFTDSGIEAMTVLDTAAGPLANLSGAQAEEGSILLFLAAGDALHEGRLRITNRSAAGEIRISGVDDTGQSFGPVTLRADGRRTVTLTSADLETGNMAKGLPTGLGAGEGDWRLVLESELSLDVFAYARSQDGVVSTAHNVASEGGRRHHVPFFNPAGDAPAGETGQQSRLRLVNPSRGDAQVLIRAWDDTGVAATGGAVNLTVAPGASTSLSAESLEGGARGLSGRFGEGKGGWRLDVQSDRDIQVMSLVEDAAGRLTNLSTTPARPGFLDPCLGGPDDADGDGVSDRCDREPDTARTLDRCSDGDFVADPDGHPGLVLDCRILVGFANHQAQGDALPEGHALRQWGTGAQSRIGSWAGIEVTGGRVTALRLPGTADEPGTADQPGGLTGAIPPELGRLFLLTELDLSGNELTGPIPWQIGDLTNLRTLDLSGNRLTGFIPREFGDLTNLRTLNLQSNRLRGTVPRALWEPIMDRELLVRYDGNTIRGFAFERPAADSPRPVWSGNAADNGNAAHHSVAYYQGPLMWEWDWQGTPREHQRPILGRWAALAVRIDHDVPEPPPVITRVLDSDGAVLAEGLDQAAPPSTLSAVSGGWRTEYVFELPGSLYQAGHQIVHVIDPDDVLAETDEDDNAGEPIILYGDRLEPFRVTFIPLHYTGDPPPQVDAEELMFATRAYLPIAEDYEVEIAAPVESGATSLSLLLDEIRARWNVEGGRNDYYHGVFLFPWPGSSESTRLRTAGIAERPGNVAVSTLSSPGVIAHEFGHNLSLRHPSGCGAGNVDPSYPYANGALGPVAGWDVNWRRFVSGDDAGYTDVMSYCGRYEFISGYQYRIASGWRPRAFPVSAAPGSAGRAAGGAGGRFGAAIGRDAAVDGGIGRRRRPGAVRSDRCSRTMEPDARSGHRQGAQGAGAGRAVHADPAGRRRRGALPGAAVREPAQPQ